MDLSSLEDFATEGAADFAKYTVPFTLLPAKMLEGEYPVPTLDWDSIPYGEDEILKVPDDKRGIYAFAVCHNDGVLPPHGYILYIGIAGRRSNRALRERYKDYLNVKKVRKRERIARMIGAWHPVLRFFFAPIEDGISSDDLEELEKKLNGALLPPFAEADLEADLKAKRRAFRL